ncbi:hypothetical protein ACH5RR_020071 [Cinchona calisaya]|uniref:Zinc finger protein n=1 Tax=Cinchona calisaya TaxID=153742 RepID=A0ABD2ZDD2_9GENT
MNLEEDNTKTTLVDQPQENQEAAGDGDNITDEPKTEDYGKMLYGLVFFFFFPALIVFFLLFYVVSVDRCDHYRRRCKLRTPCCNQVFTCRHCHNEATSTLSNPKDRHELVRQDVKQVICAVCNTEQEVSGLCSNCGVKFGEYFCEICKFYDDTIKKQFHCHECGICRILLYS